MKILITGSSGYIGSLLVSSWLSNPKIEKIIAIDSKEPKLLYSKDNPKIQFIKSDIADTDLNLINEKIDAVVHTAYIIRKPYSKKGARNQERSNFGGAENVFNFVFKNNISKLIHFSSVAVYGANSENSLDRKFTESDPIGETQIAYGVDKATIERKLEGMIKEKNPKTQVVSIRLGSVTGPFLKNIVKKSGLQSYLRVFPFVPVTHDEGARQFIHEDDVVSAINFLLEGEINPDAKSGLRLKRRRENPIIFNLAPEGHLTFKDMAILSNKIALKIPKPLAKLAFNLMWHLSLGKIPSAPGTINSYSYPILVDGSKISKIGFEYKYSSKEAFLA